MRCYEESREWSDLHPTRSKDCGEDAEYCAKYWYYLEIVSSIISLVSSDLDFRLGCVVVSGATRFTFHLDEIDL
ncbi:hypothetical protein PRIPAC_88020 [Pristionchus pacificus]|uniref:Uncharacterized protein n=1 Tax=Pristionchus pacificus TaxID=54126 RepID=A0A2A6B9I4_PRIPA|nr:hypothetical protein PRIPAC_88020 [Pristionchus pacificus]|eukprot:PDM62523.1 hypothetical protein PRIPAC_51965 [Pristionchus pacificus]